MATMVPVQPPQAGTFWLKQPICRKCGIDVVPAWRWGDRMPMQRKGRVSPDAKRRAAMPFRCPEHGRCRTDQVNYRQRMIRLMEWREDDLFSEIHI